MNRRLLFAGFLCALAGCATYQPVETADNVFRGYAVDNGLFCQFKEEHASYNVLLFVTPDKYKPAAQESADSELLAAVCTNPKDMLGMPYVIRNIDSLTPRTIRGVSMTNMMYIAVYPSKTISNTSPLERPYHFSPGRFTRLGEVVSNFGEPAEKELWRGRGIEDSIGFQGSVNWWNAVGLASTNDDTITPIFVRQ